MNEIMVLGLGDNFIFLAASRRYNYYVGRRSVIDKVVVPRIQAEERPSAAE